MLLHIAERRAWQEAQRSGVYRHPSLEAEGFIHCSTEETIRKVADRFFAGETGLLLLCIHEAALKAEVRWEGPWEGDLYPHVYGPIEIGAVINLFDFGAGPDQRFTLPDLQACPFCIRHPEFVGRMIAENQCAAYFAGNEPVLRGSGVIIPKAHRTTVFDLTPDEWAATHELLQVARRHMHDSIHPDGFNVGWNCGEAGGQVIPHAHLHVIPRFDDEPFAGRGIRSWLKRPENLRPSYRTN